MPVFCGYAQGCCAILVFRVGVGSLGKQQFDYLGMAVGGGLVQWRPAVVAGQVDIRAPGYQLTGSNEVPARGSLQKRGQAMFAGSVDESAFFDEQFHHFAVTVECGPVQRPIAGRTLGVDIGTMENQQNCDFFPSGVQPCSSRVLISTPQFRNSKTALWSPFSADWVKPLGE